MAQKAQAEVQGLISFSVYGDDERYQTGILENARVAPDIYPGWTVRVYCEDNSPVVEMLWDLDCEVFTSPRPPGHFGMFWRFFAADDTNYTHAIFRDADSILNVREKAAVNEWLADGTGYHIMRDHPDHANWPMLGGMWGTRIDKPWIKEAVYQWCAFNAWKTKLSDMRFLQQVVWPKAIRDMTHHSSVPTRHTDPRPFPLHEPYDGFVGEIMHGDS